MMTPIIWAASAYCGLLITLHLATIAIAARRCRTPARHLPPPSDAPAVTIVRPVCAIDNFVQATLRSSFELDYPCYEIIFCVASGKDPAVALINSLIAENSTAPAKLLVGDERISTNPKLNNVFKGWRAAAHDWIVIADSNVLMPRDYIQRLLASWQADTGLVSAPPIGSRPAGFWAALECAFLNTYQARWQYAADTVGLGFAQGKTLFYRRADIEEAGGLRALGAEAAEDAASTKLVRKSGRRVRLVDTPFEQPLGRRRLADVWNRQVRWAQLRRASFGHFYALEFMAGALLPIAAAVFVAMANGNSPLGFAAAVAMIWYGGEAALAAAAGWTLPLLFPVHAMLRDLMLPLLWIIGWRDHNFVWRGNTMSVTDGDGTKAV
ncbi:MAG: ceramide glucosyltransferase [Alphaproteobacteria bacterium]|nr:ceramide glucosyltransferase [Alphaproteobacteria bacterium]